MNLSTITKASPVTTIVVAWDQLEANRANKDTTGYFLVPASLAGVMTHDDNGAKVALEKKVFVRTNDILCNEQQFHEIVLKSNPCNDTLHIDGFNDINSGEYTYSTSDEFMNNLGDLKAHKAAMRTILGRLTTNMNNFMIVNESSPNIM